MTIFHAVNGATQLVCNNCRARSYFTLGDDAFVRNLMAEVNGWISGRDLDFCSVECKRLHEGFDGSPDISDHSESDPP